MAVVAKRFDVYLINLIRTVDQARLVRRLGKVEKRIQAEVLSVIGEMFAP